MAFRSRSILIKLRLTCEQEALLRRAANLVQQPLSDFILKSACVTAEQRLLDQNIFLVNEEKYQAFVNLLDQEAQDNEGLRKLLDA